MIGEELVRAHVKSQNPDALRKAANREKDIETRWLVGPEGLSGVCAGLNNVSGGWWVVGYWCSGSKRKGKMHYLPGV